MVQKGSSGFVYIFLKALKAKAWIKDISTWHVTSLLSDNSWNKQVHFCLYQYKQNYQQLFYNPLAMQV